MILIRPEGAREDWDLTAQAAYDAMAAAYDEFTANHDFELWLGNLIPLLERHGLSGHRLLDVACGTGKSLIPMLDRDWEVVGCDLSPGMVARARTKVGHRAPISVADMRTIPAFGEFDLVWCLTDAVNYLLGEKELAQAMSGFAKNLAEGGLVAFDINTVKAYRTFFAEETVIERSGRRLCWQGLVDASTFSPGSIAEARFSDSLEPDSQTLPLHRQRHFPVAEVLAALEKAQLECVGVYGIHYDAIPHQPLEEESHTKAVYIARKSLRAC
jgi:SAM-dependent methyltransferase